MARVTRRGRKYPIANSVLQSIRFTTTPTNVAIYIVSSSSNTTALLNIKEVMLRTLQMESFLMTRSANTQLEISIPIPVCTESLLDSVHAILESLSDHVEGTASLSRTYLFHLKRLVHSQIADNQASQVHANAIRANRNFSLFRTFALPSPNQSSSIQTQIDSSLPSMGVNAEKLANIDTLIPEHFLCPLTQSIMTDPAYIPGDIAVGYTLALLSTLTGDLKKAESNTIYLDEITRCYFVKGMQNSMILPECVDLTNLQSKLKQNDFIRSILAITSNQGHTSKEQRFERAWLAKQIKDQGTHPLNRGKFSVDQIVSDPILTEEISAFVTSVETPNNRV